MIVGCLAIALEPRHEPLHGRADPVERQALHRAGHGGLLHRSASLGVTRNVSMRLNVRAARTMALNFSICSLR